MSNTIFVYIFVLVPFISSTAQWIQQTSGTTKGLYTIHFINENNGWIAGEDGTILKTTNAGENWFSQSISTLDNIRSIFFADSLNGWVALYEWSPFRHGSIYHSTNGGTTWFSQIAINDFAILSLFFTDNQHGWAVGTNGIVFRTTNSGNNWQYTWIADGWLYSERFADNNIGWTVGDLFGQVAKTTNGGNSWFMQYIPTFYHLIDVFCINQNLGWAVGFNGAIINTTNGGLNWLTQLSGVTNELRDVQFIDENYGWIVGLGGRILHSYNGGASWNIQNSNTTVDFYAVAFVDELTGWVVGNNGTILKTNNGGVPVELTSFTGRCIDETVYLKWETATETNNHGFEIERCTEDGNWRIIGFIEGKGTTNEIQQYSFIDDLFEINPGKISYRLKQIDYSGSSKYSDVVSIHYSPIIEFNLAQNFPNPFNPSTIIRYAIPETQLVTLTVYNSLGEAVRELVDEVKEAGTYEIVFVAGMLTSGIYFYKLSAGEFQQTKKLILMK